MFEVGWTEMLVIAVVLIVVVGPKDLPSMLRTFGRTTSKLRSMAGDFQKQFNDALKEADLEDVKDTVNSVRSMNPMGEIKKHLNPMEKAAADIRASLDAALKPTKPPAPAAATPQATESLKAGPTAMPGEPEPAIAIPAELPAGNLAPGPAEVIAPASETKH